MGDRANIKIYMNNGKNDPIYLYSHWGGSTFYGVLKKALSRQERWDDESYLTRIIFSEMVKDNISDGTSFGISSYLCDNEHTILGVNCSTQEVTFEEESGKIKGRMSFKEFVVRKDKWSDK